MAPDPGYQAPRKTREDPTRLTPNEQTCLQMLVEGSNRNAVAEALGVSRQRVGELVKQIKAKGHDVPSRKYTRRTPAESGEPSE